MHASPGLSAPPLKALIRDGALVGDWVLDPDSSRIRLESKVLGGLIRVSGAFRQVTGRGTVSPDGGIGGTVTVAAASIDTRNRRRDTHLRSADFFDSDNNPDITFTADDISPAGQGVAVTGALTVHDRTQPLSFAAAAIIRANDEITLDAKVQINRADFGLTWNLLGMVSMHNTLTVHAVFIRR